MREIFWLDDPAVLVTSLKFVPTKKMSLGEQLNALTRLVILISIIMFLSGKKEWVTFLIFSLIIIIVIHVSKQKNSEEFTMPTKSEFEVSKRANLQDRPRYLEDSEMKTMFKEIRDIYMAVMIPCVTCKAEDHPMDPEGVTLEAIITDAEDPKPEPELEEENVVENYRRTTNYGFKIR